MVVLGQCSLIGGPLTLPAGFWDAVGVWVQKPQVVNRRLCGSQIEQGAGSGHWLPLLRRELCQAQTGEDEELLRSIANTGDLKVLLRTLIPKTNSHYSSESGSELVVKDMSNGIVTFIPLNKVDDVSIQVKRGNVYQIRLEHVKEDEWSISVMILCSDGWKSDAVVHPKPLWLINDLLPKLAKWSTEHKKSEFKSTLSLISVVRYSKLYQQLKEKYKEMVKVWPEVTDPEKFVYEDVAIATYLLILWEDEREAKQTTRKQSFIDLGCGNGLLVHILCNEGHPGKGLDVRSRNIWAMYGAQTHLEECAITPNDDFLFPDVDWLIGNHSDELTPWLPVIAARSAFSCCYFVLPCCFFNFHGKYSRRKSKKTQYREYLDFITEVGIACGFDVEEDCLRIPSTKRVCLIGKSRTYQPHDEALIDQQRMQYIQKQQPNLKLAKEDTSSCSITDNTLISNHCNKHDVISGDGAENIHVLCTEDNKRNTESMSWVCGFLPREKFEQVRNCASLPRDFIDQVVLQVANLLLSESNQDHGECMGEEHGKAWNSGSSLPLMEVAESLDRETLQRLKNECGGLQTLLRNNHQVFEVHDARVYIRDWRKEKTAKKTKEEFRRKPPSEFLKTRLCWFFMNHPDGCPLASESCLFAHGDNELRQMPQTKKQRH
ncbi:probable tRNA (uracil-O(2)-)-methyltransferase [Ambystoma mexicanum]|uniref:probable tRNA (uracil-O(2)-)-methyltransferase n=1 Tax=Ambystoma mexicanum TaxID=8296 RepID=UPI0037E96D16